MATRNMPFSPRDNFFVLVPEVGIIFRFIPRIQLYDLFAPPHTQNLKTLGLCKLRLLPLSRRSGTSRLGLRWTKQSVMSDKVQGGKSSVSGRGHSWNGGWRSRDNGRSKGLFRSWKNLWNSRKCSRWEKQCVSGRGWSSRDHCRSEGPYVAVQPHLVAEARSRMEMGRVGYTTLAVSSVIQPNPGPLIPTIEIKVGFVV